MAAYDLSAPFTKPESEEGSSHGQSIEERFPTIFRRQPPAGEEGAPTPSPGHSTPLAAATESRASEPEAPPATGFISDEDLAKQSWPEYLSGAAQNLPGSAKKQIGNVASALYNYDKTLPALWSLGEGAVSKGAGALGFEQDRQQKAKTEAGVDALVADYTKRYKGILSGDTSGLRRTFHDDPASVGMDVATLAPGVGAAGKVLGMGEKAAVAAKAASLLDPIQASATIAKKVIGKPVDYVAKGILSKTSGVPKSMLDVSENIGRGKYATPQEAAEARAAYHSNANAEDIADAYEKSLKEVQDQASQEYRNRHGLLPTTTVPTTEIQNSINNIVNQMGGHTSAAHLFPNEYATLQNMQRNLSLNPNPTLNQLDLLKKSFDNDIGALSRSGSKFRGAFAEAPRSIIDSIKQVHPEYGEMLEGWQNFIEKQRNLQQNFGKAGKSSDAKIMNKLLRGMKTPNGKNLIDLLKNTPSGKYLPEMLSGYATRDWAPGWGTGIGDAAVAALLYGTGIGFSPHMLAGAAAASPKIVGASMRGLGKAKKLGDKAAPLTGAPARNLITQAGAVGQAPPLEGVQQAAGGRIGRKSGGRIGDPGSAAEKLILAAERAKKNQGNATSALLQMPDEAITKALAVANEHI